MKRTNLNEKGQALLIVIVALTIALVIGINASVRTITSLSRTSRTDSSSRALAAAEGGLERFLILSKEAMDDVVAGNCPDLPNITDGELDGVSGCYVSFASESDAIDSEAFVTVATYAPNIYPFSLKSGQIREINLEGYTGTQVDLCWGFDPLTSTGSDLSFIVYTPSGVTHNALIRGTFPPQEPNYDASGTIPTNSSNPDYTSGCRRITLQPNSFGLRVRSIGGDSKIGAFGVNHSLPLQGYTIVSIGKLVQASNVVATRKLQMIRTLPYLPGAFDFGYYTTGDIIK